PAPPPPQRMRATPPALRGPRWRRPPRTGPSVRNDRRPRWLPPEPAPDRLGLQGVLLEVHPGELFVGAETHPETPPLSPRRAPAVGVGDHAVEGIVAVDFDAEGFDFMAPDDRARHPGRVGVDEPVVVRLKERLMPRHPLQDGTVLEQLHEAVRG